MRPAQQRSSVKLGVGQPKVQREKIDEKVMLIAGFKPVASRQKRSALRSSGSLGALQTGLVGESEAYTETVHQFVC